MNEWYVDRYKNRKRMLIICPICGEWYEIPDSIDELKCYRHCPWCGKPLGIKKEDKDGKN